MRNDNDRRGGACRTPFLAKGTLWGVLFLLLAVTAPAFAQANGQLSVSLTVQPSIRLIFTSATGLGNVALGNSGTNAVSLDLGTSGFPGAGSYTNTGALRQKGPPDVSGTEVLVSSHFNLDVQLTNSSLSHYSLKVWGGGFSPAADGNAWAANGAYWYLDIPRGKNGNAGAIQITSVVPVTPTYSNQLVGTSDHILFMQIDKNAPTGPHTLTVYFEATAQ